MTCIPMATKNIGKLPKKPMSNTKGDKVFNLGYQKALDDMKYELNKIVVWKGEEMITFIKIINILKKLNKLRDKTLSQRNKR